MTSKIIDIIFLNKKLGSLTLQAYCAANDLDSITNIYIDFLIIIFTKL